MNDKKLENIRRKIKYEKKEKLNKLLFLIISTVILIGLTIFILSKLNIFENINIIIKLYGILVLTFALYLIFQGFKMLVNENKNIGNMPKIFIFLGLILVTLTIFL